MPPQIVEVLASGAEIDAIIEERLLPTVCDIDRTKALMALLTLTLCLMKPTITGEEAMAGIQQVSQFMCLMLSETATSDEPDPKMVN